MMKESPAMVIRMIYSKGCKENFQKLFETSRFAQPNAIDKKQ
jgi:hypothetical protein